MASLRDGPVWLVLAGCAIVCGSSLAAYSFISPLLTDNAGMPSRAVPLVAYGIGALIGSNLGGRLGTNRPYAVLFTAAAATFLVLVSLALFSRQAVVVVVLVALFGLFGMSTNPVLIGKAVTYADHDARLGAQHLGGQLQDRGWLLDRRICPRIRARRERSGRRGCGDCRPLLPATGLARRSRPAPLDAHRCGGA